MDLNDKKTALLEYLKRNKRFLKISAIDKEVGLSGHLSKMVDGTRDLPDHYVEALDKVLMELAIVPPKT